MENKMCKKCGQIKTVDCFSRNKNSKDGYAVYCRQCISEKSREYRERNREDINRRKRISYHKSKEHAEERTQKQMLEGTRICNVCGIEKPITDYYKRGNGGFYSQCKSCSQKLMSEYVARNHEAIIAKKRIYHKEHKTEIDNYNKQYYQNHKNEVYQKAREWIKAHPEKARVSAVLSAQKARFLQEGLCTQFARSDWDRCKSHFSIDGKVRCAYCGTVIDNPTIDHVIPISKNGTNTPDNVVPACGKCNSSKASKDFREWYKNQSFYSEERENDIITYLIQ